MAATVRALTDSLPRWSVERATTAAVNAVLAASTNKLTNSGLGIAIATIPQQVKLTNTANYLAGGVPSTKAATDPLWTLTGPTVPFNSWQKYYLYLDAAGVASVQEGVPSNVSAAAVGVPGDPFGWSVIVNGATAPSSKAIIGSVTVKTDATHTFIPGTTALNAAGITATFQEGFDPNAIPLIGDQQLRPIVLL